MSTAYALKPWPRVAIPHDDIREGRFDLSTYAANLGQVDVQALKCPEVYRDAVTFYRATYVTPTLDELLRGVAGVLAGEGGNRVLQLRTPFGGGKTHTLIALLHLVRSREALTRSGVIAGYPDPGRKARVAVLPCLDLDATSGRTVDGLSIRTLWGELAYRLGGRDGYGVVREADERRVNPGGDVLRALLDGEPTLILLDEVLTYVEAALGVPVGDTNLGRQTMLFLQYLTEVVRGLPHAAMVYSLQQSVREAFGDEGLLEMLDSLVGRIDAKKEPVSGDDVLRVVQRRLFKDLGEPAVREAVAAEYARLHEQFLLQSSQTEGERRAAADHADILRRRILDAYPFHPELLDLMYHRWGSLPTYQRTRGALQFLATVIGALRNEGDAAGALIGPGDVLLDDAMVRSTFFSQVGEREAMKSVLDSDLLGATARCRLVDDAMAADAPHLATLKPGTRLTRALALYSFGAKPGEDRGVLRQDLLAAVQVPDLTADVLDVALHGLTETLLYIHTTGRKFRFEKKPNLNKLVDDEAKKLDADEVGAEIAGQIAEHAGAKTGFEVWPADSEKVTDGQPRFKVVFLGPEHALQSPAERERLAREWTEYCGTAKRRYRNALAFACPAADGMEHARGAARRFLAIRQLLEDRKRHGFDPEDVGDLESRRDRARTDLVAAIRRLYPTLFLPVAAPPEAQDPIRIERFDIPSYQALGAGLLESIYKALENWVFPEAVPGRLVTCVRLGDGDIGTRGHWVAGPELVDQFFGSVQFPKLLTLAGLKATVAAGVGRGAFGYLLGAVEQDGTIRPSDPEALSFRTELTSEDIDLGEGSYVVSAAFARQLAASSGKAGEAQPAASGGGPAIGEASPSGATATHGAVGERAAGTQASAKELNQVRMRFTAKGAQLYSAFNALQVLSEWAGQDFVATVDIYACGEPPLDRNTYETAVVMSLEEEGINVEKT